MIAQSRQGLTPSQVRHLNGLYFAHNPAAHFSTKLRALVEILDGYRLDSRNKTSESDSTASRMMELLPEFEFEIGDFDETVSSSFAAIEATSLVHHVGETILRLYSALLMCTANDSPWFEIASDKDPKTLHALCTRLAFTGSSSPALREEIAQLIVPPNATRATNADADLGGDPTDFIAAWLAHFASLIIPKGFDSASGHNQIKHGLALVSHTDIRIEFVPTPAEEDSPRVGDLKGGLPLINGDSIEYLDRNRLDRGHEWGWDLRIENADPVLNLAMAQVGISILDLLWSVGVWKYAPWLVAPTAHEFTYRTKPSPSDLIGRSDFKPFRVSQPLIASMLKPGKA